MSEKYRRKVTGSKLQTEFGDFMFRWSNLCSWPLGSKAGFGQCAANFLDLGPSGQTASLNAPIVVPRQGPVAQADRN